jgi:CDP-diacylglycerol--glycerol-3-phosphate 3-phosphatidyltransferase
VGLLRFGKPMSTHALLAKVFGLSLFAALTAALCFGVAGAPLFVCITLGLAANAEIVAIAFILPAWQADVPTWRQALRIRRGLPVEKSAWFN